MSKIWLITGSARGLGRHLAEAVLAAGHRLVATARQPDKLQDLVERYGDRIRTVALDVTDAAAAQVAVDVAVSAFGRLDVLVNNAGFGHAAPFEQTTEADFRAQIDTNFYGVVNLTRAALPVMRKQRSGHIIQISSVGGRMGTPGVSAYQAAKWAVGGFTEVLAKETAPFGVKVTAVEPGGMRTEWGQIARGAVPDILPDYEPSVGMLTRLLADYAGNEAGDPAKVAQVILQLADHDAPPQHLLLGSDALHFFQQADDARRAEAESWHAVSLSTDVDGGVPMPKLPLVSQTSP
jgi:NAD(P)-dependent dehydrogenase (short-subunit alcohol dehydrogenase family)